MTLSLLPITALLLLLSGAGTPVHGGACPGSSAALLAQLLRGYDALLQSSCPQPAHGPANRTGHSADAATLPAHAARKPHRLTLCLSPRNEPSSRKLYRTRFGFAEGAYLALGPPATA